MSASGGSGFFNELKRRNVFRVAIAYIVVTWLLLQVVDILVPMLTLPDWVGRLIFLLLLVGFPLALFFAWAFELTPEGVKREKDVDRSESITHVTGRKIDRTIIGVLLVALAVSMYANFNEDAETGIMSTTPEEEPEQFETTATATKPSIAVLPFANRSADDNDAFFVDGMHDDLLTQLAKISALKVISRTSVLQYRDTEKSMKTIGDELGVETLLEGGVQRAGNRIRINVQLIDTGTDEHLWAETYNRELTTDNIFEIQEEISLEIANALHATLSPDEQERIADRPTDNMRAYEAYMLGRQRLATRTDVGVAESIDYFKAAIKEDENFADAYASLAEAYMVQNNTGRLSFENTLAEVRPLLAKLEDLGQESGIVYNAMGGLAEFDGDAELAETYYRKAIEVNPSYVIAYVWLALLQTTYTGDFDEALRLYQTAADLDPMSTLVRYNLSSQLEAAGRPDEAMAEIRKAIEIDPKVPQSYMWAAQTISFGYGRVADGMVWAQKSASFESTGLNFVAFLFMQLGDFESGEIWRDAYAEYSPDSGWAGELKIGVLRSEGNLQDAAEIAISLLDNSRDAVRFDNLLRTIRDYFLRVEREGDALELYREVYPELFIDDPDANRANMRAAVDLVLLLQRVGQDDEASILAERVLPVLRATPLESLFGKYLLEVELHAILGNRDKAIDALTEAVESGWTMYVSPHNPNLASIADDPEYQRLLGVIQERIDAELAKVREMEANGQLARTPDDLPNIDFDLEL